jgi:hypothetical protein
MTPFEKIQEIREDGYPKVAEIIAKEKYKTDVKNPVFDEPLKEIDYDTE